MKCKDCPYMACRVFYWKTETSTGFCMKTKKKVTADTPCTWAEQQEFTFTN